MGKIILALLCVAGLTAQYIPPSGGGGGAPSGAAGGDLSSTYPNPTVAKVNGVAVTGTPSSGQVPTATGAAAATWQTPAGGSPASPVSSFQYNNAGAFGGTTGFTVDTLGSPNFMSAVVPDPTTRPVEALAGVGSGNLSNGTYHYSYAYLTPTGITLDSKYSQNDIGVTVVDNTTNGKVSVSAITVSSDSRVTGRRLTRTKANGSVYYILTGPTGADPTALQDNVATTYLDNISDAALVTPIEHWFGRINRTGAVIFGNDSLTFGKCIIMQFTDGDIFFPDSTDFTGLGCESTLWYGSTYLTPTSSSWDNIPLISSTGLMLGKQPIATAGLQIASSLLVTDASKQWVSGTSSTDPVFVSVTTTGVAFASLGTPANGNVKYCSDCTVTSGVNNTCVASGTGAFALRINGGWKCII